jgi:hypothetical protein
MKATVAGGEAIARELFRESSREAALLARELASRLDPILRRAIMELAPALQSVRDVISASSSLPPPQRSDVEGSAALQAASRVLQVLPSCLGLHKLPASS